jgi:hypothetical protein
MKFELDQPITTDAGLMRVRTLSHYLFFKKPRTTIFSAANPFIEDTLLTFAWDTTDSDNLGAFHQQIMKSLAQHGFIAMKQAVRRLHSNVAHEVAVGKVTLVGLLSQEVASHVTFVV